MQLLFKHVRLKQIEKKKRILISFESDAAGSDLVKIQPFLPAPLPILSSEPTVSHHKKMER